MIWKLHIKIGDMINGKYYMHTIVTVLGFNKFNLIYTKHINYWIEWAMSKFIAITAAIRPTVIASAMAHFYQCFWIKNVKTANKLNSYGKQN